MSTTYIAGIVSFLTLGLPVLGIHVVDPNSLTAFLTQLVGIGATIYTFYARYKAGGINAFGIRT